MTVERIHPKAPVMLIFIAIFTCLPSCINLSNIIKLFTQYQFGVYFTVYRIRNIMNIVKMKLAKNDITTRGHP